MLHIPPIRAARGCSGAALLVAALSVNAQMAADAAAPLTVFEAMRLAEGNAPSLEAMK